MVLMMCREGKNDNDKIANIFETIINKYVTLFLNLCKNTRARAIHAYNLNYNYR
jgi:hypothetical protein